MKTYVKYVNQNKTIKDAAKIMWKHAIGSALVEDDNGEMVGIITERDVLRHVAKSHTNDEKVSSEMTKNVIMIDKDAQIADAIDLMVKKNIKKLVVTHNEEVVGIITASDMLKSGEKLEEEALRKLAKYFPIAKAMYAG